MLITSEFGGDGIKFTLKTGAQIMTKTFRLKGLDYIDIRTFSSSAQF